MDKLNDRQSDIPTTLATLDLTPSAAFSPAEAVLSYLNQETGRKFIRCTEETDSEKKSFVRVTLIPPSRCKLDQVALMPGGIAGAEKDIAATLKRAGFNVDSPGTTTTTQEQVQTLNLAGEQASFPVTLVNYLLPCEQVEKLLGPLPDHLKSEAGNAKGIGVAANRSAGIISLPR